MTPAQIAAVSGLVLILLIIVYYLYASSSSSTASSAAVPVSTSVPAPAGTAAAASPTTKYNMATNLWYQNGPWQPAGGCPGNIPQAAATGWCAMPEAQAEALCSASSDCGAYGTNTSANWAFEESYQLFPIGSPTSTGCQSCTMFTKA